MNKFESEAESIDYYSPGMANISSTPAEADSLTPEKFSMTPDETPTVCVHLDHI